MEFDRIHANRLYRLSDYLRALDVERFDFTSWVSGSFSSDKLDCGTTACALGHAAMLPEFRALGLRLFHYPNTTATGYVGLVDSECCIIPSLGSEYASGWLEACRATKEIFGLTEKETSLLFVPEQSGLDESKPAENATPQEVAAHIVLFLEEKGYPR